MSPRAPRNIDISRAKRHEVPELAALRRAQRAAQAQKQRMASEEQQRTIELRRQALQQQAMMRGATGEVIRYDLFRENTSDSTAIPKESPLEQPAVPAMASAQPETTGQNIARSPQSARPAAQGATDAAGMPRVNPPAANVETAAFDIPVQDIMRRRPQQPGAAGNTAHTAHTAHTAAGMPQQASQTQQLTQTQVAS